MSKPPNNGPCDDAYQQGIEDTVDKIMGLIFASDGEITISELEDFLEAERSAGLGLDDSEDVIDAAL